MANIARVLGWGTGVGSSTTMPFWLRAVVGVFAGSGVYAFLAAVGWFPGAVTPADPKAFAQHVTNLAAVLALAALLVYVYHTYLLARDAWTPSASFGLQQVPTDPYQLIVPIRNHSRVALHCWMRLNATVYGQPVALPGFYNAEHSFDVQPFGTAMGYLAVADLLAGANKTIAATKATTQSPGQKDRLYMNIQFWYTPVGDPNAITPNPRQSLYFDFHRDLIVTDF